MSPFAIAHGPRLAFLALFSAGCTQTDSADTGTTEEPSCAAWREAEQVGRVDDERLIEISGVVESTQHEVLWVHNDSGGEPSVYAMRTDGTHVAEVQLDATAGDWEDISSGPCAEGTCLVVGDIGDNSESRSGIRFYVFEEPDPHAAALQAVTPRTLEATYPDGSHDAEAMIVTPAGDLVVFSKQRDGRTRAYRTSIDATGPVVMELWADAPTTDGGDLTGLTTGAAFHPSLDRLAIRTYSHIAVYGPLGDAGLQGLDDAPVVYLEAGLELAGEAVTWLGDDILHMAEGLTPAIWQLRCEETP